MPHAQTSFDDSLCRCRRDDDTAALAGSTTTDSASTLSWRGIARSVMIMISADADDELGRPSGIHFEDAISELSPFRLIS